MKKDEVINIIKEFNTTGGGTVGGFTIPTHRHNGSDSPRVLMGDLALDPRGLIFAHEIGNVVFKNTDLGLGVVSYDSTVDFIIGDNTNGQNIVFQDIAFNATTSVGWTVFPIGSTYFTEFTSFGGHTDLVIGDGTGNTMTAEFNLNGLHFSETTNTTPFYIQLPATVQPTAVAGGIYYNGTHFYVCKDGINWVILS